MSEDQDQSSTPATADFVVVANRLPVDRVVGEDGEVSWRTAPGGLVTAMEPVMASRDGAWVGWHGAADGELDPFEDAGIMLVPVPLSEQEVKDYYEGFSNATLWPLYHDSVRFPEFHREWWEAYRRVNRRFAEAVSRVANEGAVVWVQDYQLQLVPAMLRELRPDLRIGFFLHIPFPPVELFVQLPWRSQLIEGLCGADVVGFQIPSDARNFIRVCRDRGGLITDEERIALPSGRTVQARAYPISIDVDAFEALARSEAAQAEAAEMRHNLGDPKVMILGVDRLDYTKGITQRVRAIGELFQEGRLDPEDVVFVQVATPSREHVEEYMKLRDEIELLVGRINGDLGRVGRPGIVYLHSYYPRQTMAAMYQLADLMLVTPIRDGMNLVAKEYVACRPDESGALVLSEFAGAAYELDEAYMVNPYDINALKDTVMQALEDPPEDKAERMRALRAWLDEHDIQAWADSYLADLEDLG
ncbi:MAG TPA: trehalose-6-phosphate synthase [Actinomycetales bacterium]|nr:trehalose-6-phosphate synthase [Actinomycetales bacterium]